MANDKQEKHEFELKNGLYICKWCHHPQRSYGKQNNCVPHGGLIDVPRVPAGTPLRSFTAVHNGVPSQDATIARMGKAKHD